MNQNSVEIHEFSTGIIPSTNSTTGEWVSMGFTGEYMNSTLDPIPFNVERAIANKLFAVVEGFTTDSPAIIGRVVPGRQDSPNNNPDDKKDWSVVAIINRGKDEKGRPLTVHRYFLSEGKHQLSAIVAFIENYRKLHGVFPVFDPMDKKSVGVYEMPPEDYSPPTMNEELDLDREGNLPAVICNSKFDLLTTHIRATIKANQVQQLVSWAFQVEALETPQLFLYINTNNPDACKRITNTLADSPSIMAGERIPVDFDEKMVKGAIKKLISNRRVKEDAVQVIVDAVNNEQITDQQWLQWFRAEGLERAIQDKNFNNSTIRLLTLAALVIPKTKISSHSNSYSVLWNLLQWLQNNKNLENQDIFENFIYDFIQFLDETNQERKIEQNINYILAQSLYLVLDQNQRVSPEAIANLLAEHSSHKFKKNRRSLKKQLIRDVKNDLETINQLKSPQTSPTKTQGTQSFIYPESLWMRIKGNWNYLSSHPIKDYQSLAKLFKLIKEYKLAAYFYQISQGIVPHEISTEVGKKPEFCGVAIKYELSNKEKLSQAIDKTKSWLPFKPTLILLLPFIIIFAAICIILPVYFFDINQNNSVSETYDCKDEDCSTKKLKMLEEQVNSLTTKFVEENLSPILHEKEIKDKIVLALKEIIFGEDKDKYGYAGVIDIKGNELTEDIKEQRKKWNEKIDSWAENHQSKTCILEPEKDSSSCIKLLKEQLTKQYKINLNNLLTEIKTIKENLSREITTEGLNDANSQFETQTFKSIQDITKNSPTKINQLKNILGGNLPNIPKDYKNVTEITKLKWIQAILNYQKNKIRNPDGVIEDKGTTFYNLSLKINK